MDEKKICSKCGAEVKENLKFCTKCGTKYQEPEAIKINKICKKCGAEASENTKFCSKCGNDLTAIETPTPPNSNINIDVANFKETQEYKDFVLKGETSEEMQKLEEKKDSSLKKGMLYVVLGIACIITIVTGINSFTRIKEKWNMKESTPAVYVTKSNSNKEATIENTKSQNNEAWAKLEAIETEKRKKNPGKIVRRDVDELEEYINLRYTNEQINKGIVKTWEAMGYYNEEDFNNDYEDITKVQNNNGSQNNIASNTYQNDYIFSSDIQYIKYAQLVNYSRQQVALIRNEIYARHGYIFKRKEYQNYFGSKYWYTPNPNFSEKLFNTIEKENIKTIKAYEKSMGW